MQTITGKTGLFGVIGDPISHSLSPLIHNAALEALGLDLVYVAFAITPKNLAMAIAGLEVIGVQGFNVTIPHKQAIIPLLTEITAIAKEVGAVNTVYRTEQGWQGTNTDVAGFISPLQRMAQNWSSITPLVIGNGGAARAVVVGLRELGCQKIQVVGRNFDKLRQLQSSWSDSSLAHRLQIHSWDDLAALIPNAQLLINTTPLGMAPRINESPVADNIMQTLPSTAIVYDLIYTPSPTRFLSQAKQQGAQIIDGSDMLVNQGAASLQRWLNQEIPVEAMAQALQRHLFSN